MLACVDVSKPNYIASDNLGLLNFATTNSTPTFEIKPQQMSMRRLPMQWFCEMANAVMGDNGELLEYKHLIANPKTRATWTHSYGNEIGRLAQGMPGRNTGTNTIFFIRKDRSRRNAQRTSRTASSRLSSDLKKLTNLTGRG